MANIANKFEICVFDSLPILPDCFLMVAANLLIDSDMNTIPLQLAL